MSDEELFIVQTWVNEMLKLPEITLDTAHQSWSTMNDTICELHKGGATKRPIKDW